MSSFTLHKIGSLLTQPLIPKADILEGGSFSKINEYKTARLNKPSKVKMNMIEPSSTKDKLKVFIAFDFK